VATKTASGLLRITCPAGVVLGETRDLSGPGCHCRVAKEVITARHNPSTLIQFCTDKYENCPVWRKHREAYWEDQHRKLQRDIDAAARTEDL
jgi:hypothetical protein